MFFFHWQCVKIGATLQLDFLQKCSSRSTCEEAPCLRSLTGNTILSGELAWVAQKISFSGSKQCWLWGLCWVNNSTSNKQYLRVCFLRSHTPELEYTQRMLKSMGLKVTKHCKPVFWECSLTGSLAEKRGLAIWSPQPERGSSLCSSQPVWSSCQDHLPQGHWNWTRPGLHKCRWEFRVCVYFRKNASCLANYSQFPWCPCQDVIIGLSKASL